MILPKEVKKFFWDIDISKATPARHKKYYISRILDKGDGKSVSWLFKMFGRGVVKRSVSSLKLTPRSANYWQKFFQVT